MSSDVRVMTSGQTSPNALMERVYEIEQSEHARLAFTRDPSGYLADRGVHDFTVEVGWMKVGLFDLLTAADADTRVAVARTVASRVRTIPAEANEQPG